MSEEYDDYEDELPYCFGSYTPGSEECDFRCPFAGECMNASNLEDEW